MYERNEFSGRPVVLVVVADAEATVYGIFETTVAMAASVATVGRRLLSVSRRSSPVSSAVNILATVCIFSVVVIFVAGWLFGMVVVIVVVAWEFALALVLVVLVE